MYNKQGNRISAIYTCNAQIKTKFLTLETNCTISGLNIVVGINNFKKRYKTMK